MELHIFMSKFDHGLLIPIKGRLDCDSRRVFYTTLEATQTRRTDLWVFTLLLSESRLFCVFLFLNGGYFTARSPLDRCVHQLAKSFQYSYIACLLLMVYGDYLCISIYFWLIELHIDLLIVFFYELVWCFINTFWYWCLFDVDSICFIAIWYLIGWYV